MKRIITIVILSLLTIAAYGQDSLVLSTVPDCNWEATYVGSNPLPWQIAFGSYDFSHYVNGYRAYLKSDVYEASKLDNQVGYNIRNAVAKYFNIIIRSVNDKLGRERYCVGTIDVDIPKTPIYGTATTKVTVYIIDYEKEAEQAQKDQELIQSVYDRYVNF